VLPLLLSGDEQRGVDGAQLVHELSRGARGQSERAQLGAGSALPLGQLFEPLPVLCELALARPE
jgi:hypothetical protein